jgi:hypothetical protein
MSDSSGTQQQTQQTNTSPWAGQAPYLADIFAQAQQRFNSGSPQYYPGQTVAAPSDATTGAQDYLKNLVPSLQASNNTTMGAANYNLTSGRDLQNDPYLNSAINAVNQPVIQQFTQSGGPLDQVTQMQVAGSGDSGGTSSREGIAQGIALRGLGQQLTNNAATMTNNAYEGAQNRATQTLGMMPGLNAAQSYPGQVLSSVGAQQDAYSQAVLNDAIQRYNFQQNQPDAKLAQYKNLIAGNYGSQGYAQNNYPGADPLMQALGIGSLIYSLA